MTDKLKPCPFCNGKARVRKVGNGYVVMCSSCGSRGQRVVIKEWHYNKFIAQGQAIDKWNRRADNDR